MRKSIARLANEPGREGAFLLTQTTHLKRWVCSLIFHDEWMGGEQCQSLGIIAMG